MAEKSKIRFVCGKQTFTLKRDLDTGIWDHDSHDLKVVHRYQRDGEAANFKIVDAVCGMLNDGLTTPERGVAAAKKLWKIANGERANILEALPEVILGSLKMGCFDKSVVRLWNKDFCSALSLERAVRGGATFKSWAELPPLRFDPVLCEGAWLRAAMEACDRMKGAEPFGPGFNPEFAIAIAALNIASGWRQDLKLWPDYLEWAFRYPDLQPIAAATLPKLYGGSDRWQLRTTPLHEIIAILGAGEPGDCFGEPGNALWRALSTHMSSAGWSFMSRDQGNVGLRMGAAAMILRTAQHGDLGPRMDALGMVAWSIALSELRAACSEAGGIVLAGRGQTPLNAVFEEAWEQAVSLLELPANSDLGPQWALDMVHCIRKGNFSVPQFNDDYQAVFNDF